MALNKTFSTKFGVNATYWKISKFMRLDYNNKMCTVLIDGFIDKDSRDDGNKAIDIKTYNFHEDDFPLTYDDNENPVKICYDTIKLLDEWEGAEDC